jgi:hypothetical protein
MPIHVNVPTDALSGIAVIKEIRSIHQWSYKADRTIEFTVMGIPKDLRINADHIPATLKYQEEPMITTMSMSTS